MVRVGLEEFGIWYNSLPHNELRTATGIVMLPVFIAFDTASVAAIARAATQVKDMRNVILKFNL